MTGNALFPRDTPLLKYGKKHRPPFVVRWWYNRFDAVIGRHVLDHVFYDRVKWRQDEIYMTDDKVKADFIRAPINLKAYQGEAND